MNEILVTGGTGYIGSATVKALIANKNSVIIVDNLSNSDKRYLNPKATFYQVDLTNKSELDKVFSKHQINQIIHFAAYKSVEESMSNLEKYSKNIIGTINLLDCMVKHNIKKIIFSSSAAVYGEPITVPIDENHLTNPVNYYGFTKLDCENIIQQYSKLKGIVGICLRYFNVIGDAGLNYIETHPENILPIIQEVLDGKREKLTVFGNDYQTKDGTCIRDYIDLNDLVRAHLLAMNLEQSEIINLGTAKGTSVLELIRWVENKNGKKVKYEFGPRRKGDPAIITASYEKAKRVLGWIPEF